MVARNRFVISGTMGTSETWSISTHYAGAGGIVSGGTALTDWCETVAADIDTWVGSTLGNWLSVQGKITEVNAYEYGAAGPAVAIGQSVVTDVSGLANVSAPYQTCVCFTLKTAITGASFRGRNYWPAPGLTVGATGLFPASAATAELYRLLLRFIADSAPSIGETVPVVYSPTKDLVTPVTSVEIDTVPDIQRSRADALIGQRFSTPYV